MKKLAMLTLVPIFALASGHAFAQSCRDIPRLMAQLEKGAEKVRADAPAQQAMRQFGAICPAALSAHRALSSMVTIMSRDPNRCGATTAQFTELRQWKEYMDINSDCGRP